MAKRKSGSGKVVVAALLILAVAGLVLIGIRYLNPTGSKQPSSQSAAPEQLAGVGPEGSGGAPQLNVLKNRTTAPTNVKDYTVPQIISIPHDFLDQEGRRKRSQWYPTARL